MTEDEKKVLEKAYKRLRVCDVCGEQLFNDGHTIEELKGVTYCLCDKHYDARMRVREMCKP